MKKTGPRVIVRWTTRAFVALSVALALTACFEEEMEGVSYQGANHTDEAAAEVTLNGEGGIMLANEHGYSGNICCVNVPKKWRSGLTMTVSWEDGGRWLLDAQGKEVIREGRTVLVRGIRKSKTVEIPEYTTPETLWVHFFPHDEVKVVMSKYWPGHAKHPLPDPEAPERARRSLAEQEAALQSKQNNPKKP